mgnify:CR=1 FL=1
MSHSSSDLVFPILSRLSINKFNSTNDLSKPVKSFNLVCPVNHRLCRWDLKRLAAPLWINPLVFGHIPALKKRALSVSCNSSQKFRNHKGWSLQTPKVFFGQYSYYWYFMFYHNKLHVPHYELPYMDHLDPHLTTLDQCLFEFVFKLQNPGPFAVQSR